MNILYCNIGDMNSYNGIKNDSIRGGGEYNNNNIGHEVNNFTNHNGVFYGFVQSNNNTIDISRHYNCKQDDEYVDNTLVVWIVRKRFIVGYYKDATVFRKLQFTPDSITANREYSDYNIMAKNAVLIPREERVFQIHYPSRMNIWYGDENTNKLVFDYIEKYDSERKNALNEIESFSEPLKGIEKKALVKIRENQGKFRDILLQKYKSKCCLCGVAKDDLLIASHIKPWSKSDDNEKLSAYNGLLLCPNHDKLFDSGYISFDDNGKILISPQLDDSAIMFLNINKDMRLNTEILTNEMLYFIKYHRDHIFKSI